MKLPVEWLKEHNKKDTDVHNLIHKLTLAGIECKLINHNNKPVIDFSLTPNRADCFSLKGILQEIAAIDNKKLKKLKTQTSKINHNQTLPVEIESTQDCPVFITRVIKDFDNKISSPQWLKDRLELCGFKSVNLVVDIANYVMLETGQPLHTYDFDSVDSKIIVRRAKNKELIKILDGSSKILNKDFLVIADKDKTLGIAGIMGSEASGISETTTSILLESAYFNFETIMGKSRLLNLYSEASLRFERGVDPNIQSHAVERFTELLNQEAGGNNGPIKQTLSNKDKPENKFIFLRKNQIRKTLGVTIPNKSIVNILKRLNMELQEKDFGYEGWSVKAPSYRFDLQDECDLIEEIARIYGYEKIPESTEKQNINLQLSSLRVEKKNKISNLLCNFGYSEVVNYSFVSPAMNLLSKKSYSDALDIQNPLSIDMSVMRNSLWPGLMTNLSHNIKRQQNDICLFEIGKVFSSHKKIPDEKLVISGLAYGNRHNEQWGETTKSVDFYDVKGHLEDIFNQFQITGNISFKKIKHNMLCPGKSASIQLRNKTIGFIGELNPELSDELKLDSSPVMFELDYDALKMNKQINHIPTKYFPYSRRDLSILMDIDMEIKSIIKMIDALKIKDLSKIIIFDVYMGDKMSADKKSVALGLIFQSKSRTLKDDEIDKYMLKINQLILKEMNLIIR
ncbi:MAG TPA: phenylalanine--tRNA ligase subunit beta [Gammaproteobacteria bacterium]|nr:phenylalanine--tRNA ligase subunit beta [Gammaproteobacteria bacterium]